MLSRDAVISGNNIHIFLDVSPCRFCLQRICLFFDALLKSRTGREAVLEPELVFDSSVLLQYAVVFALELIFCHRLGSHLEHLVASLHRV